MAEHRTIEDQKTEDQRTERLAKDEDAAGGTVSVGGMVLRMDDDPPPQCKLCGMEGGQHLAQCPRSDVP